MKSVACAVLVAAIVIPATPAAAGQPKAVPYYAGKIVMQERPGDPGEVFIDMRGKNPVEYRVPGESSIASIPDGIKSQWNLDLSVSLGETIGIGYAVAVDKGKRANVSVRICRPGIPNGAACEWKNEIIDATSAPRYPDCVPGKACLPALHKGGREVFMGSVVFRFEKPEELKAGKYEYTVYVNDRRAFGKAFNISTTAGVRCPD
jgi:hypothetical protein